MKKIDFKKLVVSFSVVIILVLISMILTKNTMGFYEEIAKPDLAPPPIVFPIVWTILYTVIAITLYRFWDNKKIRKILILNLVINIMWPILFFRVKMLFVSIVWLLILIVSLLYNLVKLYKEDKLFAYINLVYLIWLFFALYLNIMVLFLN